MVRELPHQQLPDNAMTLALVRIAEVEAEQTRRCASGHPVIQQVTFRAPVSACPANGVCGDQRIRHDSRRCTEH
jgi:hypothetical protein